MDVDFGVVLAYTVSNKVAMVVQSVNASVAVSAMVVSLRFGPPTDLALSDSSSPYRSPFLVNFCNLFDGE